MVTSDIEPWPSKEIADRFQAFFLKHPDWLETRPDFERYEGLEECSVRLDNGNFLDIERTRTTARIIDNEGQIFVHDAGGNLGDPTPLIVSFYQNSNDGRKYNRRHVALQRALEDLATVADRMHSFQVSAYVPERARQDAGGVYEFQSAFRVQVDTQEGLGVMVDEIKKMCGAEEYTDQSLVKSLEEAGIKVPGVRGGANRLQDQFTTLFPNADPEALEGILFKADYGFRGLQKTTDETHTGVVFRYVIDGKVVYCKASEDDGMLVREAGYLEDAWKEPLMRVITPKLVGLVRSDPVTGLLTYGTENIGIVPLEDAMTYIELKRDLTSQFAEQYRLDVGQLEHNPLLTDMFNRALAHTKMRKYKDKPVYKLSLLESVASVDKLDDWLQNTSAPREVVGQILELFPFYSAIEDEVAEYDTRATVLASYDARPENLFPSRSGFRPLGDMGLAKAGTPEFDIGKMETENIGPYNTAYTFFRNALEQRDGHNFELDGRDAAQLAKRSHKVAFVNAMRLASYKLSRNQDATPHLELAQTYRNQLISMPIMGAEVR
jgi:hypothetical protein